MAKISFRSLEKGDSNQLQSLFFQLTGAPIAEFDIDALISDPKCHTAIIEADGVVIGFGALVRYTVPSKGEVGRIEDIVVDEKYRGQGLGKKLMEKLVSLAKAENVRKIYLTSKPHRTAARSLYESLGFKKGETEVFYLDLE